MTKKRLETEIRQDQIAEAALDIVRLEGLQALNVGAIAQKVGIVPSAIYRHYENKSEIVSAVLQLIGRRLRSHFQEVANQNSESIEKLKLLLDKHIKLISSNSAIPRIIFSEEVIGGIPSHRQKLYDIIQDVIGNVAAIIRDGQEEGVIRKDLDAESMAVAFMGMIQPVAIFWSLSAGEFDIINHSQKSWKLFSDSIQIGVKKKKQ
jgi:AcrR family transcriptional regulator